MHFSVVFSGPEDMDLTYGLVYVPGPCWIRPGGHFGDSPGRTLVNMADRGDYRIGGVDLLLKAAPELEAAWRQDPHMDVVVVAHRSGHGTPTDLRNLQDDLRRNGVRPVTITL